MIIWSKKNIQFKKTMLVIILPDFWEVSLGFIVNWVQNRYDELWPSMVASIVDLEGRLLQEACQPPLHNIPSLIITRVALILGKVPWYSHDITHRFQRRENKLNLISFRGVGGGEIQFTYGYWYLYNTISVVTV